MNVNKLEMPKFGKMQMIGLIFALQLVVLLSSLDESIVAPAMPQLISELHGLDRFCWVGTAYLLAAVAAMPIVGLLSDIYGRKTVLLVSSGLFTLSSVFCGLAGSFSTWIAGDGMAQLILFRVLQGISGGALEGLCLAVLNDVFGPVGRVKYMWLLSLSCALAAVFGPAVGAFIIGKLSWRWIFFINLPIGLISILFLVLSMHSTKSASTASQGEAIEEATERNENSKDIGGMLALVGSILCLLLGLNSMATTGLFSIPVLAFVLSTVVCFALFLQIERNHKNPAIPLSILTNPTVLCCISGQMLTGAYMLTATFFLPMLLSMRLHKSAAEAANYITCFILGMVLGSILGGQCLSRIGQCRIVGLPGALLTAAGFFVLANAGVNSVDSIMLASASVVGAGIGFRLPLHSFIAQLATPADMTGLITSLMQAIRDIGGSIGLALASTALLVISSQFHLHSGAQSALRSIPDGLTAVFYICAGLAVLSGILDLFLPAHYSSLQPVEA